MKANACPEPDSKVSQIPKDMKDFYVELMKSLQFGMNVGDKGARDQKKKNMKELRDKIKKEMAKIKQEYNSLGKRGGGAKKTLIGGKMGSTGCKEKIKTLRQSPEIGKFEKDWKVYKECVLPFKANKSPDGQAEFEKNKGAFSTSPLSPQHLQLLEKYYSKKQQLDKASSVMSPSAFAKSKLSKFKEGYRAKSQGLALQTKSTFKSAKKFAKDTAAVGRAVGTSIKKSGQAIKRGAEATARGTVNLGKKIADTRVVKGTVKAAKKVGEIGIVKDIATGTVALGKLGYHGSRVAAKGTVAGLKYASNKTGATSLAKATARGAIQSKNFAGDVGRSIGRTGADITKSIGRTAGDAGRYVGRKTGDAGRYVKRKGFKIKEYSKLKGEKYGKAFVKGVNTVARYGTGVKLLSKGAKKLSEKAEIADLKLSGKFQNAVNLKAKFDYKKNKNIKKQTKKIAKLNRQIRYQKGKEKIKTRNSELKEKQSKINEKSKFQKINRNTLRAGINAAKNLSRLTADTKRKQKKETILRKWGKNEDKEFVSKQQTKANEAVRKAENARMKINQRSQINKNSSGYRNSLSSLRLNKLKGKLSTQEQNKLTKLAAKQIQAPTPAPAQKAPSEPLKPSAAVQQQIDKSKQELEQKKQILSNELERLKTKRKDNEVPLPLPPSAYPVGEVTPQQQQFQQQQFQQQQFQQQQLQQQQQQLQQQQELEPE